MMSDNPALKTDWILKCDDDGCSWWECRYCGFNLDSLEPPHEFCPSCGHPMTKSACYSVFNHLLDSMWKGCGWCNDIGKNPENWECSLCDGQGNSVTVGGQVVWTEAYFCPVCGKPLTDVSVQRLLDIMNEDKYE